MVNVFFQFDMLELDRFAKPLVSFPLLLDQVGYLPDTEDLTHDEDARTYWLQCFEDATEKVGGVVSIIRRKTVVTPMERLQSCSKPSISFALINSFRAWQLQRPDCTGKQETAWRPQNF